MYALKLGRTPVSATRDEALPTDAAPSAQPAAAGVSAVSAVAPQRKRFRAVVCRTITESTTVEFEADETTNFNGISEDIVAQVPADAIWTRDDNNSWSYIDRVEDLGPAGGALSDDEALMTPEDEAPADAALSDDADADEEEQPVAQAAARKRGKRRATRQTAEEATLAVQAIIDAATAAEQSAEPTVEGAEALIVTLQGLRDDLEAVQSESFTDDLPEEDAAAYELVDNTLGVLDDMIATAEESKAALEAEAASTAAA